MLCVVPLAGPDFYSDAYGAKPFVQVGDETLIEATLGRRAWLRDGALQTQDIVFVMRQTPATSEAVERLSNLFPGARFAWLSDLSGGALLSALAGVALARDGKGPLLVDLVDLAFESDSRLLTRLLDADAPDGVLPWFESDDPAYSYLRLEGDRVLETAEKRVISRHASAGVYGFSGPAAFLRAAAGSLAQDPAYRVRGALFLCPAYNALIAEGARVEAMQVVDVRAYSKSFHSPSSPALDHAP